MPFLCLLGEAKQRACKAAWYAKWFVHRALRPEEFGGLVHMTKTGQATTPCTATSAEVAGIAERFSKNGTYFLPLAFPEGSPQHPLTRRSCDDGRGVRHDPQGRLRRKPLVHHLPDNGAIVTANADGRSLVPYTGSDADHITINGEINKLASNIGQARDFAGIHWRSDSD